MLYGKSTFSGVTIKALNATIPTLRFGIPVTNLSAGSEKQMLFKLVAPYSSSNRLLVISLSGGSGNADLFVRRSSLPTTVTYNWSSRKDNNEEDVYISHSYSGMFHFVLSFVEMISCTELFNISFSNHILMFLVRLFPM